MAEKGSDPPLRTEHNPDRPAITTAQAADRLEKSRFHVSELVKAGSLDGYGIPGAKRTRWYVYLDALDSPSSPPPGPTRTPDALKEHVEGQPLVATLREIRDGITAVQDQRRDSRRQLLGAYDAATFANPAPELQELIRSVNDSERRNFTLDDDLAQVHALVNALLDRLHDQNQEPRD